eukprot:4130215-Heterocapsa_arctica.AAC.1
MLPPSSHSSRAALGVPSSSSPKPSSTGRSASLGPTVTGPSRAPPGLTLAAPRLGPSLLWNHNSLPAKISRYSSGRPRKSVKPSSAQMR